jgi:ubiquitin C-terminal hydrolase
MGEDRSESWVFDHIQDYVTTKRRNRTFLFTFTFCMTHMLVSSKPGIDNGISLSEDEECDSEAVAGLPLFIIFCYDRVDSDLLDINTGIPMGIENIGNSCFMSCALQVLLVCPNLHSYLSQIDLAAAVSTTNPLGTLFHLKSCLRNVGSGGKIIGALRSFVLSSSSSVIYFKAVVDMQTPTFRGNLQHDAQEFLSYLIDMHEDLNFAARKDGEHHQPNRSDCTSMEAWQAHQVSVRIHQMFSSSLK